MPNRILKESICTSENIDALSPQDEVFFYRLLVNCDDYGRLDARPAILRARCFPLKQITTAALVKSLLALVQNNLVYLYESESQPYLLIVTWESHQQIRAKHSKYPAPDMTCVSLQSSEIICNHLIAYVPVIQSNPIQSKAKGAEPALLKKEYGEFHNVLLTDDEYAKLKERFNGQTDTKIAELSEALKSKKGYAQKYTDHYATILSWDRRASKQIPEGQKPSSVSPKPHYEALN